MKRNLLFIVILCGGLSFAQTTGKVGIETNSPTETLDVKGTVRIQNLPQDGVGIVSTPSAGTNFKATKTVVVDDNGVLGTEDYVSRKEVDGIYTPVEKCTKGVFDSDTQNSKVLKFENYEFKTKQGNFGRVDIYAKYIGPKGANYNKVKLAKESGDGSVNGVNGDAEVSSTEFSQIANSISFQNSNSQSGSMIVPVSAASFTWRMNTLNRANEYPNAKKVYSFCVRQYVF